MTLTLKTAKHAVGKYGEIFDIVEDSSGFNAHSVTRKEAIEGEEAGYQLTPCIVVTTAREALEAAWELAHEIEGDTVPRKAAYIQRSSLPFLYTINTYGYVHERPDDGTDGEHRLLDIE